MRTPYPSDLTVAEWECVRRSLRPLSHRVRPRTRPLRCILDAIFYAMRIGCLWRYLPYNFPLWQMVFYHFRRFASQWHPARAL